MTSGPRFLDDDAILNAERGRELRCPTDVVAQSEEEPCVRRARDVDRTRFEPEAVADALPVLVVDEERDETLVLVRALVAVAVLAQAQDEVRLDDGEQFR